MFQCNLCVRKYTRAFNLRNHLRIHKGERPFICRVCGRAFTRQHDRKTHEQLHTGGIGWTCQGLLKNGENWGCGRRYNRKSNLSRHFQSNKGRDCLKPLLIEKPMERNAATKVIGSSIARQETRSMPNLNRSSQLVDPEHSDTIMLTDGARTLNIRDFLGIPSAGARPMISQATALHTIEKLSTANVNFDWRHTAAAHKLLMWPSVKTLLDPHKHDQDYIMRLEEQRRIIGANSPRVSYATDETTLSTWPLAHDGGGGSGNKCTLDRISIVHACETCLAHNSDAEIDQFGLVSLDRKTARRYYQSYLDCMHKLHPFLDQQEIDLKVEAFIECFCSRTPSPTTDLNALCGKQRRKRSHTGLEATEHFVDPTSTLPGRLVDRNIDNAVILLVFAVGAVCESKYSLPGPVVDQELDYRIPHIPGHVGPDPATDNTHALNHGFSPALSNCAKKTITSFYAPFQTFSQSFCSSATGPSIQETVPERTTSASQNKCAHVRNQSFTPGLTLYEHATATIGHLQGGVKLGYIHACLLAGLYAGQLTHPFESHGWINQAARACQLLVRQPRYEELEGYTKELCNFAYWSCLQLESDLLEELDIPASGISRYESWIPFPKGRYATAATDGPNSPSTMMMMFYYSQIHLHRTLSQVHADLYKVEKHGQSCWLPCVQETQSKNLELWRACLPEIMRWKDSDEPAKDINAARMRASYYLTRYYIHRPLLYYALHYSKSSAWIGWEDSPAGSSSSTQTQLHRDDGHMRRMVSDIGSPPRNSPLSFAQNWTPPAFKLCDLPSKLRRACRICVESAISNITAFDGIEERLVVTNTFGMAHAHFGNLLVLSATYNSSLSELVERSTLDYLFKRTIGFLLRRENTSPALRADARILAAIYSKLFHHPPMPTDA